MKKIHIVLIIVFALLFISGASLAVYWPQLFPPKKVDSKPEVKNTPEIAIPEIQTAAPEAFCPLDDESTTAQNSLRRPLAVMIENHPDARPQTGLTKACIVYETVAEGGITRYMAIFLHNDVDNIGPVRSARSYYADLAKQYDAIYAHCGGPTTIYNVIRKLGLADLDQFANDNAYWRIKTRYAPHNLYTSTNKLYKAAADHKYKASSSLPKLNFKDDSSMDMRPAGASIDINFSHPEFAVHYEYDRQINQYNRFIAGKPDIDAGNNQQVSPKNIIMQYVSISKIAGDIKGRMQANLMGSGKAIIFQDGIVSQGTWQRSSVSSLTHYFDANGNEVKLNRGQTWIELVDPYDMKFTYQTAPTGATPTPSGN